MDIKSGLAGLKGAGKSVTLNAFLAIFYDDIIEGFRAWLKPVTVDDIKMFVSGEKTLPLPGDIVKNISGYSEMIERITPKRFFNALYNARPDLAEALVECGDAGINYLQKLREALIVIAKGEVQLQAQTEVKETATETQNTEAGATVNTQGKTEPVKLYKVTCDSCGKSWPITKELFSEIHSCPFCGAKKEAEQQ